MKTRLKLIWWLLTHKYFILLTWDDGKDYVNVKAEYKKEHKTDHPVVNEVVETIWKHIYHGRENEDK